METIDINIFMMIVRHLPFCSIVTFAKTKEKYYHNFISNLHINNYSKLYQLAYSDNHYNIVYTSLYYLLAQEGSLLFKYSK